MRTVEKIFVACLFITASAFARLPPLDDELRHLAATDIVTGTVVGVESELVDKSAGDVDSHHRVIIKVESVAKGDIVPMNMITVNYWQMVSRRGDGWSGNCGQNSKMMLGSDVEVYMTKRESGEYDLLVPNGFRVLSDKMVPFYHAVYQSDVVKDAFGPFAFNFMVLSQTYRCPGCFMFVVVGKNNDVSGTQQFEAHSFQTEMDLASRTISVKLMH